MTGSQRPGKHCGGCHENEAMMDLDLLPDGSYSAPCSDKRQFSAMQTSMDHDHTNSMARKAMQGASASLPVLARQSSSTRCP